MSMTASAIASKNYYAGTAQKEFTSGGAELYIGYDYNYSQVYVGCIRFTLAKRASRVDISGIRTYGYNNTASNKPLYYAVSQTLNDPRYINKTDTDGALGSVYWTALEQGRDITLYDVPAGTNYLYLWALSGHHSRSRFWDVPESISYEPVLGSSIASISSTVETLGSLAISMDRADSAHVHRATFSCEGTELGQSELFGVSLSYAVPREWFSGYPNKAALSITVSIQTYEDAAGSTATGDAVTATFTLKADGGMKPAVGEGFAAAAPYNTGAVSGFSGYVKGYSKAQVSFDEAKVDMSATAGASIAGYSITAMGSTDNEEPYLTPILTGSTGIVCTVTDSRGRSASVTLQITVLDYSAPAVTSLQAVRCASDGAEDEGGSYIAVTASALYSELEGENELQLSARISAADGSFDDSYSIESGTAAVLGGTLSPDKSYTITVTATDKLGNSGQSQIKLVTRKWALKFNAKGTAAAFGGAPEHDKMLELKDGWGLMIDGKMLESIIPAVAVTSEELLSLLYYRKGDSVYIDYSTATYVTSGGTRIRWAIFLGREVKASSFNLSGVLTVRQGGNYLFGDGNENTSIASLTMTNKKINANVLSVDILKDDGYTGATNNSPVGVLFRGTITFT